MPANAQMIIMRGHGNKWKALPHERRAVYERRASLARSAASEHTSEQWQDARSNLMVLQERLAQERAAPRPPLQLSTCKLSNADLFSWNARFSSPAFSKGTLRDCRAQASKAPVPDPLEQSRLSECPIYVEPSCEKPEWLAPVCLHRTDFQDTALLFDLDEGVIVFKFLYAMQSPHFACFSPLEWIEPSMETCSVMNASVWESQVQTTWAQRFRVDFMNCVSADTLPIAHLDDLYVLPQLIYLGGNVLASDMDPIPWSAFYQSLSTMQVATSEAKSRTQNVASSVPSTLLQQHPWLEGYMDSASSAKRTHRNAAPTHDEPVDAPSEAAEAMDDTAIEEVFRQLEAKREECHMLRAQEVQDFKVSLLGGMWTQRTSGRPFDAFKAQARRGEAEVWCGLYGLQKSARWDLGLYGEGNAAVFAKAWCHKMQYLFDLWSLSDGVGYEYTAADFERYVEPDDFSSMAASLTPAGLQRVAQIRNLKPSRAVCCD